MNVLLNRYCWQRSYCCQLECVQAETPEDPIYVKTSNGWNAAYAHGNEYAEFRVIGNGAKLQDPYHILLQKNVGMMVSFVDKKELQNDSGFVERSRSMGNRLLASTCQQS